MDDELFPGAGVTVSQILTPHGGSLKQGNVPLSKPDEELFPGAGVTVNQVLFGKVAETVGKWKSDPVNALKQIPKDLSSAARNVGAYSAGLMGDIDPMIGPGGPAGDAINAMGITERDRIVPNSEELMDKFGDREHWSNVPAMVAAPGPGEIAAAGKTAIGGAKIAGNAMLAAAPLAKTASTVVMKKAVKRGSKNALADEHTLDVAGQARLTESKPLAAGENEIVGKLGRHEQEAGRNLIRDKRARHPLSDGWAPIKAKKIRHTKTKKGETALAVDWEPVQYGFARNAQGKLLSGGSRTARKNKIAQGIVDEVNEVRRRAQAGDRNAQVIVRQQEWYQGMRRELREKYGGIGNLFADLLGAASPMTAVKLNYRYAAEVLERFTKGGFRKELKAFDDHVKNGGTVGNYDGPQITQPNGKLYGANSDNLMLALYNMWEGTGKAPKARNFSGNLIGSTNAATIDVWAARFMQRLAGLRRIPPVAETSVKGTWNVPRTKVGGDFGFGQEVFEDAAKQLGMNPDDLQALVWFREKELWGTNRWTSKLGEGGSFEQEALKNPSERAFAGLSTDRPDAPATLESMKPVQDRIWTTISNDPQVKAVKVEPTVGMYMDDVEPSFDIEVVTKPGHDPRTLFDEVASTAKSSNQDSAFVSRVITDPMMDSDNVRPGMEVYFAKPTDADGAQATITKLRELGVDGFTLVKDPRGGVVGVRYQYVPEFDVMYGNASLDNIESMVESQRDALYDMIDGVSDLDNISHAEVMSYDTVVMTGKNYDEFIGQGQNRLAAKGGEGWPRRTLRESVAKATGQSAEAPAIGGEVPGGNALIGKSQ